MERMQKGDAIALYNNKLYNIVSILIAFVTHPIKFFTKGFWNIPTHVVVYIGDGKIAESFMLKKLSIYDWKERYEGKKKYTIHRIKNVKQSEQRKIVKYLEKRIGANYDYIALLGYVLFPILQFFGKMNPLDRKEDFYCSEAWARAVYDSTKRTFQKDVSYVSPIDVVEDHLTYEVK